MVPLLSPATPGLAFSPPIPTSEIAPDGGVDATKLAPPAVGSVLVTMLPGWSTPTHSVVDGQASALTGPMPGGGVAVQLDAPTPGSVETATVAPPVERSDATQVVVAGTHATVDT